ncbi:MAG: hypothetical protein V7K21_21440 [Nostoc sp.]|uniref:hypothetical protein n=1 Tax=Nostoc sp. TaxID=1180 RepID=UPI002FFAEC07
MPYGNSTRGYANAFAFALKPFKVPDLSQYLENLTSISFSYWEKDFKFSPLEHGEGG